MRKTKNLMMSLGGDSVDMSKVCTKCGIEKELSEFYDNKNLRDGHLNSCKACCLRYCQARRADSVIGKKIRERKNAHQKRMYHSYPEYKESILAKKRLYIKNNRAKIKEYHRKYNQRPEVKMLATDKVIEWRKNNPLKAKVIARRSYRKRMLIPANRLNNAVHAGVAASLKKKKSRSKWQVLVGYTLSKLKNHLESQFTEGMSWDNYGKWHIDHIIPQSFFVFDSSDDVEFKMCWRLENLQPLWAMDNFVKNGRVA